MYHVECIDIREKSFEYDYSDYSCLSSNNMYNVSNFYIRNLMTGLKKPENRRTPNEKEVITTVQESIPDINRVLLDKYNLKAANIRKDKNLTQTEKTEKIQKLKCKQFTMPTADLWFAGWALLNAVFKYTRNTDYRNHHSHLVQKAISTCVEAWESFFRQPAEGNGLGKKRIPRYRKSSGRSTAIFTNEACKIDHKQLKFPYALLSGKTKKQRLILDIGKLPHASRDKLIEVRIVPYFGSYQIQIVTDDGLAEEDILPKEEDIIDEKGNPAGVMILDPGVNNFAAITDNKGNTPIVIKGGAIKARNQWFNKQMSRLKSELMKGHDPKTYHPPTTKQMKRISRKRDAFLKDTFYKYAHTICRIMAERGLSYLIIGHNKGQKNGAHMGHVNNQTFVGIPFARFNQILETVARKYKIRVIQQEESYTSKACFAAKDPVPVYGEEEVQTTSFSGKRVKRGLYKDHRGKILNADINGSANIGRKYNPGIFPENMDISYLYGTVKALTYADILKKKYSR